MSAQPTDSTVSMSVERVRKEGTYAVARRNLELIQEWIEGGTLGRVS